MSINFKQIKKYIAEKKLIKVSTIDDVKYYGIPLVSSEKWIIFLLITDFHIDGYILLNTKYIKEITTLDMKNYQNIIEKMSIIKTSMLTKHNKLKTLPDVIKSIQYKLITYNTLKNPWKRLFTKIVNFDGSILEMLEFRSTWKRLKKPHKISHSEIGFIQRSSEYLLTYEKYVFCHKI